MAQAKCFSNFVENTAISSISVKMSFTELFCAAIVSEMLWMVAEFSSEVATSVSISFVFLFYINTKWLEVKKLKNEK